VTTLTFSIIGTPAPQGSKTKNRYGAVYESSAKVKPWRQDVRAAARAAIECRACGGSGADDTRAYECSPECNGSHADITGRPVCPRGPEMCEECSGTGRTGPTFPTGPVIVGIRFRLARPKGHYGTGRNAGQLRRSAPVAPDTKPDIDKLVRSTLDGMGEAGVWRDDAQVVGLCVVKDYATDEHPPGATVSVDAYGASLGVSLLSVVR
jgi:hypothetical protein